MDFIIQYVFIYFYSAAQNYLIPKGLVLGLQEKVLLGHKGGNVRIAR